MINPCDITVVVQGDVRANTCEALQSIRSTLPGARIVLSTFHGEPADELRDLADEVILSEDPGDQVPYTRSGFATRNNLNRQITSSRAGLAVVRTSYALKLRSDALVRSDAFLRTYSAVLRKDPRDRLLACSHFTRHPDGLSGYLFHVSDWVMFGRTTQLAEFWNVPLMTDDESTWFERHSHRRGGTRAARRFRARFTPEQHLTIAYARGRGYVVPKYLDERSAQLVAEYKRFLGSEVLIDSHNGLGFALPKYEYVDRSLFQLIDCVNPCDWADFADAGIGRDVIDRPHSSMRERVVRNGLRHVAHSTRHSLIALVLTRQHLVRLAGALLTRYAGSLRPKNRINK